MSSSSVGLDEIKTISSEPPNSKKLCGICHKDEALYTCPQCNTPYCSLKCYRDEAHADCSESFYKACVLEELKARSETGDPESCRRIQEALVKLYEQGPEEDEIEQLDSDDDESEDDLADRLKDIDLNDADAVWAQLSQAEKADFKKMVESGQVHDLLPEWTPWWVVKPVQELENDESHSTQSPKIVADVPKFSELCKSKPAACLPFNVANTIAGYVYCMRQFQGDPYSEPLEAAGLACTIAGSLRKKENFSSFSHAVAAAAAEAVARDEISGGVMDLLRTDVDSISNNPQFLKAALSDLLTLFRTAVQSSKGQKKTKSGAFTRQFSKDESVNKISVSEMKSIIKKVEFYLSWAIEFT